MNEEEMEIVDKMNRFGGSFVKCLSECFYHADRNNINRLKTAFPEYWEQYRNFSK